MKRLLPLLVALCLIPCACGVRKPPQSALSGEPASDEPVSGEEVVDDRHGASKGVQDPRLASLLLDSWEATMRSYPVWSTGLGDSRYDDRMGSSSPEARALRLAEQEAFLARALAIPADELSPADLLNRDLFVEQLRRNLAREVCRFQDWNVSPRRNPLAMAEGLAEDHPMVRPEDGANLVARYRELPRIFEESAANLRVGLSEGWVTNAESTRRTVAIGRELLARPESEWRMGEPALESPESWDSAAFESFAAELREVLAELVRPAIESYVDFLELELLPAARSDEAVGLTVLPEGPACYEVLVRHFTTLEVTADELHALGLRELESIHEEFRVLGQSLWGTDDLASIFERLRTDPDLYFGSSEEVEEAANRALQTATARMGEAFDRLPQADCVVEPIPDLLAPYTTIAYYGRPAPDGSRPGRYWVNVHAPETRPRHEAEVLAFHEAIPGHHLQIAIAQELGELPAFRRTMGATAFVEGWALYSERLSDEMGLYSSDLDRMGMLSFDAWRAARLVVDTGLHSQGRSREWAVQFLLDNTPLAANNIDNEVDRYITTPGQALAYKTGQVEILALRRQAEEALGDRFRLGSFHEVVLGGGAVTLPVLRGRVESWIESESLLLAEP